MNTELGNQWNMECCYAVQNGHLRILSESEFRRMQMEEIRKFQDSAGKRDNSTASVWIQQHAQSFRETWSKFTFRSQEIKHTVIAEIHKHRWIESEKAGADLGIDAEMDWLIKYGYLFKQGG